MTTTDRRKEPDAAAPDAATMEQQAKDRQAKDQFDDWFGDQGLDEDGTFDADEMERAFEAGYRTAREATAAAQERPAPGELADWWVCDGPLPPRGTGKKILGPFGSQELALSVRSHTGQPGLWVDDEPAVPAGERPAPELGALLADWRKTADSLKDRHGVGDARERNVLEVVIAQVEAIAARHARPAPELAAAMREARAMRDVVCKLLDLYGAPDDRLMQHSSVTRATLQRYAKEAGVRLDGRDGK